MTSSYKRNISSQLLALRSIFIVSIILIIYLAEQSRLYYTVFIAILLLPTFIIPLTSVTIDNEGVHLVKHSLFGLVVKRIDLNPKNILSMTNHGDLLELDDSSIYNVARLLDFILLLSPAKTLVTNITELHYTDMNFKTQSVKIKLTTKEYKLTWYHLNQKAL